MSTTKVILKTPSVNSSKKLFHRKDDIFLCEFAAYKTLKDYMFVNTCKSAIDYLNK
jgi:hypothetical protein